MWELLLAWLPGFSGILGATMLLSGVTAGLHRSVYHVFGYSNAHLFGDDAGMTRGKSFYLQDFYHLVTGEDAGITLPDIGVLPDCLLSGGLMSISSGLGWVVLTHYGYISETTLVYGVSLGGIIGIGYSWIRRRMWNADIPVFWHLIGWGVVGALLGGIVSGKVSEMIYPWDNYILNEERRVWWVGGILIALGGMSGIRKMIKREVVSVQFLLDGLLAGLTGGCVGMLVSGVVSELLSKVVLRFPGGLCAGVFIGMAGAVLMIWVGLIAFPLAMVFAQLVSVAMTPLVILLGTKPIICPHCLRYTKPLRPKLYKNGTRCCEHCHTWIEWWIHTPGKVIFTFGNFSEVDLKKLQPEDQRVIVQTNPTFGHVQADTQNALFLASRFHLDHYEHPVDVSEVYIDTTTCDPWRIDRFITYILNHPPKHGVRSVKIFYQGDLDELGRNLKNALYNNFISVEQMS